MRVRSIVSRLIHYPTAILVYMSVLRITVIFPTRHFRCSSHLHASTKGKKVVLEKSITQNMDETAAFKFKQGKLIIRDFSLVYSCSLTKLNISRRFYKYNQT